jgi:hypothetical protein
MGVDTKMFIATKKENILEVMPKVIKSINEWQRFELQTTFIKEGFESVLQFLYSSEENLKNWSNGIHNISTYDFSCFNIDFRVNGEGRSLFVTHACSNDHSDTYNGEKIIFSLGCWGRSEEIMMVVAEAIKEFGDIYYTHNDCQDEFKKLTLTEEELPLMNSCDVASDPRGYCNRENQCYYCQK